MTTVKTSACMRFGRGPDTEVDAFIRLTSASYLTCCVYPDHPPSLVIDDAHVKVSISVPDPDRVTAEDVAAARRLEEDVARYATELETLADTHGQAVPSGDEAGWAA